MAGSHCLRARNKSHIGLKMFNHFAVSLELGRTVASVTNCDAPWRIVTDWTIDQLRGVASISLEIFSRIGNAFLGRGDPLP